MHARAVASAPVGTQMVFVGRPVAFPWYVLYARGINNNNNTYIYNNSAGMRYIIKKKKMRVLPRCNNNNNIIIIIAGIDSVFVCVLLDGITHTV